MSLADTWQLNNGVDIPKIGLGVFRSPAGQMTENAVRYALDAGYRHIDTAKVYGNERSVGEAVRASGIPRSQIFVTTKLWNNDHGYDAALAACQNSLDQLGFDYIDLYLIHWPVVDLRLDTWRAMETLLLQGKCRAIGISNYMVRHLQELLEHARVLPAVNQIELSPYNYLYRKELVDLCRANGIHLAAYSPLTKAQKLQDPKLLRLAEKYGKTPAQVLIRWVLQQGIVALPKSTNQARIRQNGDVFDFVITDEDMAYLEGFNEDLVTGWDPTDAP